MATAKDISGNSPQVFDTDRLIDGIKPNRTNAGSPSGSLTPEYPGELVYDTTNSVFYKAIGTAATDWQQISVEIEK